MRVWRSLRPREWEKEYPPQVVGRILGDLRGWAWYVVGVGGC